MRLLTIKLLNGLFCELKMCDSESNFFLSHSLSLPKDFHKKRKFLDYRFNQPVWDNCVFQKRFTKRYGDYNSLSSHDFIRYTLLLPLFFSTLSHHTCHTTTLQLCGDPVTKKCNICSSRLIVFFKKIFNKIFKKIFKKIP